MAKTLTSQPLLSSLIEHIQLLDRSVEKKHIADALEVLPQEVSRMLKKEADGKAIPRYVIPRLQLKFKHLLKKDEVPIGIESYIKALSVCLEKITKLEGHVERLNKIVLSRLTASELEASEVTMREDLERRIDVLQAKRLS